jgi:hypothetical protein
MKNTDISSDLRLILRALCDTYQDFARLMLLENRVSLGFRQAGCLF